jgi:outer membrane protein TolC
VRSGVAVAWLDLAYALRAHEILARLAARHETQAEAVAAGVAQGRRGTAESFMLRGAAGQARDREAEHGREVARARIALAAWIGPEAERPLADPPDTSRLAQPLESLLARLPAHPQLEVSGRREALAQSEAELARSTKKPDWSLQIGYAQREPAFSNMLSVMVAFDLPWQAGRRQDRDIAARLAELERARAQREDAHRQTEAEIRGWHADHATAAARIERHRAVLLPLARGRVEAATAAYRGGRGELDAVLDAHRALAEAELALNAVEAQRARAWASLHFIYPDEASR